MHIRIHHRKSFIRHDEVSRHRAASAEPCGYYSRLFGLNPVQARAVVPKEFPLGGIGQRQFHEQFDRVWEPAVWMRIVGGEHHIVVAKPFDKISNRMFFRLDRNKAIALEELRWFLREFYFEPSGVVLIVIIQSPEQPWSP